MNAPPYMAFHGFILPVKQEARFAGKYPCELGSFRCDHSDKPLRTAAQLYYGAYKSSNVARNGIVVEQFLMTVEVIESDRQIARRFGIVKADLTNRGATVTDSDLLIAATTIERCSFLVTGNIRHFQMIDGLEMRNWRAPGSRACPGGWLDLL